MNNIYIDESGSMCKNPRNIGDRFFFIGMVKVNNQDRVKRRMKRLISKNLNDLKLIDEQHYLNETEKGHAKPSSMFVNGKFNELKGSVLTREMKFKFIDYICVDNILEVFLIKVDNQKLNEHFFDNIARSFNYILKLALKNIYTNKLLDGDLFLHLDNRNVRTNTVYLLEEYLNTELVTADNYYTKIKAEYFQSENCSLIQIADVIANIHYSSQFSYEYKKELQKLQDNGYIKNSFTFPITSPAYKAS